MTTQCAWCWLIADAAGLFTIQASALVTTRGWSHGMCPACYAIEVAKLATRKAN